jgi:RNA polymerase sigma factor (sigma-70 family)
MLHRPPTTDAALVQAARCGRPSAWRVLFERYNQSITAACRAHGLSNADTADVQQTTWLRALERIEQLRDPECLGPWLGTVARHECLRVVRQAARLSPCDEETLWREHDLEAVPDARLLESERRAAVQSAVRSLPPRDRVLLILLYSQAQPSYAEIGRSLRMPIGPIGPTRRRVLDRLRQHGNLATLAA